MSTLVGNLVPRALNFFHVSVNKKCLGYVTAFVGLIFVGDLVGKLIPIKWNGEFVINVSTPGNVADTILVITFMKLSFPRNYHNIKYIISHKLHRRIKNSVKHPRGSLFANIVR